MTNVAAGSSAPAEYLLFDVPLPGLDDLPVVQRRERPAAARPRTTDRQLAISERTVQQFWSHVVPTTLDGCAYYVGAVSAPDGYGRFNYTQGSAQRTVSAHRFAMELVVGELDEDAVCEHKCNEPLCVWVDPDHVVLSTQSENVRYAVALGRLAGPIPLDPQGRRDAHAISGRSTFVPRSSTGTTRKRYTGQRRTPETSTCCSDRLQLASA